VRERQPQRRRSNAGSAGNAERESAKLEAASVQIDDYNSYIILALIWATRRIDAKKCLAIFEEVATGRAARYARGAYPEIVHLSHHRWLEQLKKVSETHS
jgi:hypothetical protein